MIVSYFKDNKEYIFYIYDKCIDIFLPNQHQVDCIDFELLNNKIIIEEEMRDSFDQEVLNYFNRYLENSTFI